MLVLTRHAQQSILIGDDIEVTVCAIVGRKVWLRISCPRLSPPVREEILQLENLVHVDEQVDVQVVMLRPEDGQVRLGVSAPRDVPIARDEIRGLLTNNRVHSRRS